MNNKKYLIAIFLMFSSIANAQNYKINIVLDNNSNKYTNSIKNEVQALFSSVDKIDYNLIVCANDCDKYINNSDKKLVILNEKIICHVVMDYSYLGGKIIQDHNLKFG